MKEERFKLERKRGEKNVKTVEEEIKKRLGRERRKLKDQFKLITRNGVKTHLLHLAAIDFQLSFRLILGPSIMVYRPRTYY